jgi:hypothetical protein
MNTAKAGTPEETQRARLQELLKTKIEIKHKFSPITLIGEVIDVWCYTSEIMGEGKGEKHKTCALACGGGGMPLGILEDKTGQVYVACKSNKAFKGCNEILLPYVAQRVKVTGYVARKGGCQALRIEKVELAKK